MADDRMALLETLRKATADGDVDFLREGVRVLAQAIMEAEVSELTGRPQGRARPRAPADAPQRVPRPPLGHAGRHDRPRRPEGPRRRLPPVASSSRAAAPSAPCSRSSRRRTCGRQHAPGRRPRPGPGDRRDQQSEVSRICAGARRRGRGVPVPPARRARLPVPLARRHVPQGPRGRAGSCRWRPSSRSGSRPTGERRVLGSRARRRATTRARPGRRSSAGWSSAASTGSGSSSATTTRASSRPSGSSSWARAGSAAGSTSPATPRTSCPVARGAWSPPPSGSCSSSPTRHRPATSAPASSPPWSHAIPAVAGLLADAEPDLLTHFTFPELHRSRIRSTNPPGAAQQGDPGVELVPAGRTATAARTVGDRAAA